MGSELSTQNYPANVNYILILRPLPVFTALFKLRAFRFGACGQASSFLVKGSVDVTLNA